MINRQNMTWAAALVALSLLGGLPMVFGPPEGRSYLTPFDSEWLVIGSMGVMWGLFVAVALPPGRALLRRLRQSAVVFAFSVTGVFVTCVLIGLAVLQPMRIHPLPKFTFYWVGFCMWLALFLILFQGNVRQMGQRIMRSGADRWLIPLVTLLLLLLGMELFLRYGAVYSEGHGRTYAHRQWMHQYWAENSLGYRDREPAPTDAQVILVTGDSFVAGHGIAQPEGRFADRLGVLLGNDAETFIVAQPGWQTDQQMIGLAEYPLEPDVVVLSYFTNDISSAYEQVTGQQLIDVTGPTSPFLQLLLENYFVPNFTYWYFFNPFSQRAAVYLDGQLAAYENEAVWEVHRGQIRDIVNWTREQDAEIVVILWPQLVDLDLFDVPLNKVSAELDAYQIPYVDMRDIAAQYPVRERIVNPQDTHPSVLLHEQAALALYDLLVEGE